MSTILLSCYRCEPDGVSEAYSGYKWAEMLGRRHRVLLCTPEYNVPAIRARLDSEGATAPRIEPLGVPVADWDARTGALGTAVKPGFFAYDRALMRMLRGNGAHEDADIVWHRTPMSFRHPSALHRLGRPFVVGPLGGGLRPPEAMRDYFRGEGALYGLRRIDPLLLRSRSWMRYLDAASAVLIACDYMRDILPERLEGRMRTVLDVGVEPRPAVDRSARVPGNALFVGRLVRYKGPVLAVEAFARFRAGHPEVGDATLTLVGDGPERAACEAAADAAGIAGHVRFLGRLPKERVLDLYDEADVFLFPSVTEASGNVYLEAMRAGLPSVVVDNGGGRYIPSSECAVRVPVNDAAAMVCALAEGLGRLWSDADLRARMGAAARERVASEFTWEAIAEKAYAIVDEVVAGSGGRGA